MTDLHSSSDDLKSGEVSDAEIAITRSGKVKATWRAIAAISGVLLAAGGLFVTIQIHHGDKNVHLRETERQDSAVVTAEIRTTLQQLKDSMVRIEAKVDIQNRDIDSIRRDLAVEMARHKAAKE